MTAQKHAVSLIGARDLLARVEQLDGELEALQVKRDRATSRLEAAANAWEKQGGKSLLNPNHATFGCNVCSLKFAGVMSSDVVQRQTKGTLFPPEEHLTFGTTCTYGCGRGVGVDVPVSFVNRYLEEHQ